MGWAKEFAEGLSGGLAAPIKDIVSEFITDKDAALRMEHELKTQITAIAGREAEIANEQVLAQLEINKIEASHPSLFVSGGRPAAIWVCVFTLGSALILMPWAAFLLETIKYWHDASHVVKSPEIDMFTMFTVLGPLLGLGGYRTYETIKGVQKNNLKGG